MIILQKYNVQLKNLIMFLHWVNQRYSIHLKKDYYKQPSPWTNDPVLQQYSFTNVRRIQDRVSKYLLTHVCNNQALTLQEKLLNIIWFRIFNQPSTFQLFGFPIRSDDLEPQFPVVHERYLSMIPNGIVLARGAYMISGVMNATYQDVRGYSTTLMPWHIIWKLYHDKELFSKLMSLIRGNNGNEAFEIINGIRGIGQFLAYQIYVDLTYCPETLLTQDDFVYLGGGAKRGVSIVFPDVPQKQYPLVIKDMQFDINELMEKYIGTSLYDLMIDLDINERRISLSNMQNCFCEFSKYFRYRDSQVKTKKRLYTPS